MEAARSRDPAERARGLETLFAAYWVRLRWGHPPEDAQDLMQGFFVELLERGLLARFDPQNGCCDLTRRQERCHGICCV
jgi:hypothetical protein